MARFHGDWPLHVAASQLQTALPTIGLDKAKSSIACVPSLQAPSIAMSSLSRPIKPKQYSGGKMPVKGLIVLKSSIGIPGGPNDEHDRRFKTRAV